MTLVPRARLLWLAVDIAFVAVLAAVYPPAGPVWLLAAAAALALALGDAAFSYARSAPIAISVPAVCRFTRDRQGSVPVVITGKPGRRRTFRLGLGLPGAFESLTDSLDVERPADAARCRTEWRCTPRRRGTYEGLWACSEVPS
ncbi:MAG TPA: hypothetical protein VGG37_07555, partial [Opitutaceae bacterium]